MTTIEAGPDTGSRKRVRNAAMRCLPETFDLVAHYQPRADFSLSPSVRRQLKDLGKRYSQATLMTGSHSGRPSLQTDIKGISVGTRIEISRLVFRRGKTREVLANAMRLFVEAAERGVASGPIKSIEMQYRKHLYRGEGREAARDAYRDVFGEDCCFLTTKKRKLELGRAVVHQSLLEHLREAGPYHSMHQNLVEAVRNELQKQPGRYEQHKFFVKPMVSGQDGDRPTVVFCYSGDARDQLVEVAMRSRAEATLEFVTPDDVKSHPEQYVSLEDYERAARRFGTLWVMQGDLIRPLERQHAAALYLFMDDDGQPLLDQSMTWQEMFDLLKHCGHVNRASRQSPTYLDVCLHQFERGGFVKRNAREQTWRLNPGIVDYMHVTFYELGEYDRRLTS